MSSTGGSTCARSERRPLSPSWIERLVQQGTWRSPCHKCLPVVVCELFNLISEACAAGESHSVNCAVGRSTRKNLAFQGPFSHGVTADTWSKNGRSPQYSGRTRRLSRWDDADTSPISTLLVYTPHNVTPRTVDFQLSMDSVWLPGDLPPQKNQRAWDPASCLRKEVR